MKVIISTLLIAVAVTVINATEKRSLDLDFDFLMLRKLEGKIKFRYIFKRLLPLEKSPIKSNWLATILINDTAEDLEEKKERFKWENTIQYLLETGVKLAQTLIKDVLEDSEHEIPHCCSINVKLHQNVQDFLVFAGWFLFVDGGHVLCAIGSEDRCRMS